MPFYAHYQVECVLPRGLRSGGGMLKGGTICFANFSNGLSRASFADFRCVLVSSKERRIGV